MSITGTFHNHVIVTDMAPTKNYTPYQMSCAMEAVKKGESVSSAARTYGVPRITLRNKITGKSPAVCSMGPYSVLSKDEETILVEWLFAMSRRHCPVAKEQLLDSVQLIVKSDRRETPFTEGRPGRKWYQAFLKRHPEVTERVCQNLTTSREAVTQEQIHKWFSEVQQYFEENQLHDVLKDPKRVFNSDESAFFLNPNTGHVLVKKGDKNVYTVSGNEKENLTVLITANAAGQFAPPMIVFAYERIPKHVADSVPDSWAIGKSDNGWMCSSTFYEYITNIFHPWLIQNKIELPVVFFLDGHASHLTKHLSDFCSENKIEIIALYPNSTHLLQPMDLAVFRPLKAFWRKHIRKWKTENLGQQVKKENFAAILKCALEELSPDCVRNGFRAGGLFPFGPDYIDFSKMHAHNRRYTNTTQLMTSKDLEFFVKLEQEIVNIFTQSKLEMYRKNYFVPRDDLSENLPSEDLALYTIWAKYRHICQSNTTEIDESNNPSLSQAITPQINTPTTSFSESNILKETFLGDGYLSDDGKCDTLSLPQMTNNLIDTGALHENQQGEEAHITQKTPTKTTATTSLADHMLKEKKIIVPSPFKKALFWPDPDIKKKGRKLKEKLPSAITGKAWKEFYQKKDLDKKTKEIEKEKRKQERIEKRIRKIELMSNKKRTEDKIKARKRRKQSVSSSETEESDITYAETGESDIEAESDLENNSNSGNRNLTCNDENKEQEPTEMTQIYYENSEEDMTVQVTNLPSQEKIQILDSIDVQMILDENTGTFRVTPIKSGQVDRAEVGKYILVKFDGKNTKRTYRYVCTIQEVYADKIIVQGLRSRKSKNTFKIIENDVSIINESDILSYLPEPVRQNDNFVFPFVIDVKELI